VGFVSGPDGEEGRAGFGAITDGDRCGIDEKVEFASAQESDPVKPLHACRETRRVDGTRGEAVWREGETATSGSARGVVWNPGGGIERCEVGLEHELELDDGSSGVRG
jgi:hypothetical protein